MSIICSNNCGWVVSHLTYVNSIYKSEKANDGFKVKKEMFEINTPYLKDDEALKKFALHENSSCQEDRRAPKRRKKNAPDTVEDFSEQYTSIKKEVSILYA
jgi:hypothetical protein